MTIENILKALETSKVKYAVIGGVAVALHGYLRFTNDLDLIISFSRINVSRFARALKMLNFRPGPPVDVADLADKNKRKEWIRDKNAMVITFYNPDEPMIQIDVLLAKDLSEIGTTRKPLGNFEITVIDYHDLIKMKKKTGRQIDQNDIEKLKEIRDDRE